MNELCLSLISLLSWLSNVGVCNIFFLRNGDFILLDDVILLISESVLSLLTILCLSALLLIALPANDFASLTVNLSPLLGAVLSVLLCSIFAKNDLSFLS